MNECENGYCGAVTSYCNMADRRSQSRMSALEVQNLIAALMCEDHPDSDLELLSDENLDYDTDVDIDILSSLSQTPVQAAAGASNIQDGSSQAVASSAASVTLALLILLVIIRLLLLEGQRKIL